MQMMSPSERLRGREPMLIQAEEEYLECQEAGVWVRPLESSSWLIRWISEITFIVRKIYVLDVVCR